MYADLKEKRDVFNPATGEKIAEMKDTSVNEVHSLYEKARSAFSMWSSISIQERIKHLRHLRLYMSTHLDEICETISKDTGKVKVEALTADVMSVLDGIHHIEQHAEEILQTTKMKTPIFLIGKKSFVDYMPRGVVLVISPWNYPMNLAMVPVVSALVSGNTVILKPSEVTPLVGKCIEELFYKSGFPEGVVQVAHGDGKLGAALTAGKPDYIFFTGSVATGKKIQAQAAQDLIPTTLELGGKDPMVVFANANLERAAKGAVWGAFTNSGQVCMSIERLYVERPVYEKLVQYIVKEVNQLSQGTGIDDDIGSMTFPNQVEIVRAHVEDALKKGATLLTGEKPTDWNVEKGLFIKPMVLTNVTHEMDIANEETFGPILPIIPFDTEEEVVHLANRTEYGLNASVWSNDIEKARRVARRLVSGGVVINDVILTVANHGLPFGGTKHSGIGRYHGDIGLRTFCHEKAIMIDPGQRKTEINWYPYKGKYEGLKKMLKSYYSGNKNWTSFLKSYLSLKK
jgi:acyl-CoA reductase-like NAD-dependent aldehyde dehydrogenase